jgi:hypothetical protein
MKYLLCRIWFSGRGELTRGDLLWVADQLDEAECRVPRRDRLVDWIVSHVSPFPLPRTTQEYVARAMVWAQETVKPNKPKKVLEHVDVLQSDFVKGDALARYEKGRDIYRLACSLCSINVKHAAGLSEQAICRIIEQIDAFLADETPDASGPVSIPAPFELVLTP